MPDSGRQSSAAPRDNQQIQDDNMSSDESVKSQQPSGDVPNQAANKEPTEGSRENPGGISNRPLEEERDNQGRVPPRGNGKEGGNA